MTVQSKAEKPEAMNWIEVFELVLRWFLGVQFFVFGVNGFFHFLPLPKATPDMEQFMAGLYSAGPLMNMVKGIQIICGLALLLNQAVPLALVFLGAIIFVILTVQWTFQRKQFWILIPQILLPWLTLVTFHRSIFGILL
ncbi:MAG: DoxX family membrane protein [Pseudobdellovibrionaceae bacterium]